MTKAKPEETALAKNSYIKLELNKVANVKKEFSDEQAKFVKSLVNPDLTDVELIVFLSFANKLELNPFLGEIIPVVYGKNTSDRKVNYIITRTGKRVVAGRTGELQSISSDAIYVAGGERVEPWAGGATLWGAESMVMRRGVPYRATVKFSEYNTGRNVWASKPETMIKKVAESQALSAAFPEILGAVYDESEADSMTPKPLEVIGADEPATIQQIETLEQMGYTPEELQDITRGKATELLTSKRSK